KQALREQRNALTEVGKITRDRDEAASYAIQLNTSRKQFDVKLKMLKLRRGTLATQLTAAKNGGDIFGNDPAVWDRFKAAEDKIDEESIATEVDAAMRTDDEAKAQEFDAKLLRASDAAGGV